jgi:hypothetical protein
MGFFDIYRTENEVPKPPAIPDWLVPPAHVVGKPLGETMVIYTSEQCAVILTQFVAYPCGLAWDISLRFADHFPGSSHHLAWEGPERAMYGIELSDGTPVLPHQHDHWPPDTRPDGPVLNHCGGSGDNTSFTFGLWLNPLPTEAFHIIFAWPAVGIEEIRAEIAFADLAETASQSIVLWPAK